MTFVDVFQTTSTSFRLLGGLQRILEMRLVRTPASPWPPLHVTSDLRMNRAGTIKFYSFSRWWARIFDFQNTKLSGFAPHFLFPTKAFPGLAEFRIPHTIHTCIGGCEVWSSVRAHSHRTRRPIMAFSEHQIKNSRCRTESNS